MRATLERLRMNDDHAERPAGVIIAAVLIAVMAVAGIVARARVVDFGVLPAIWLIIHISSVVVAVGLWKLKRWAYWLFIAFVVGSVVLTVARLTSAGSPSGSGYHLARIGIMAAWLVYFSRWQVRGAFAPPGSGYGR